MSEPKHRDRRTKPRAPAAPAPAFEIGTRAVAVLLALLTIFLFWEVSIGGRTFVSPDTTAPAGFVRMGEHSLWQDKVYPLWNPYVFLGMPSFASGAYNPLIYPPDWPLALVQRVVPLPEMTWMLLYYFLGALFMYGLARELGARAEAALLAGVAFMFGPNLVAVGSHGHGSQLVNSAYVPLLVWLAARWMRRGGMQHIGWLALAGGFQLLRGHVQIAFYTWLAVAVFVLIEWIQALRRGEARTATLRALGVPLAALLAFALAGFYNLPLRAYAAHSIRGGGEGGGAGLPYATQWSLGWSELPTLVIPGWAGFGNPTYWGSMPFTDYPNAFLGIVPVLLLVPAFLARPKRAAGAFALALGVFALLVSLGRNFPLYGLLYDHLPLFNKFRIPVMMVILVQLAAALAAAWGWTTVLDLRGAKGREAARLDRALVVLGIACLALFVVGVLGQDLWREAYGRMAMAAKSAGGMVVGQQGYGPEHALAAWRMTVTDLALASVLGLLTVAVAWLARRGSLAPPVASAIVLVLLLANLWPVSARVMAPTIGDPVANRLEAGRDDLVRFLEQQPGPFRILPFDEFGSNRFAGFGIATVGGYHAAKPRLVQRLFDSGVIESTNLFWMRLLNVRYFVINGLLPEVPDFLREAYRSPRGQVVYENLAVLPRATVIGAYRVAATDTAAIDSIARGAGDPALVTWLDHDPGLTLGPATGATATIQRYRLNDVTIAVDTPGPALLRLADAWYPDWKATVDGRPVGILRADFLLRAVPVPAGRSTVVFRFESASQRLGLVLSLAALAVILALLAWSFVAERRARARAAESGRAGEAA